MNARHKEGAVAAGYEGNPQVGVLGNVRVVGGNDDDLCSPVLRLGDEVAVRGSGLIKVGSGNDYVGALIPVGAFTVLGLIAPHGGGVVGKIVVPLVVTAVYTSEEVVVPLTGYEAHQTHRRNRGERGDVIWTVFLDSVDLSGGNDLCGSIPGYPLPAALSAGGLVLHSPVLVLDYARPRLHGILALCPLLLPHVPENLSHVGVSGSQG